MKINLSKSKIIALSLLVTELVSVALLAIIFAVPLYSETAGYGFTVSHVLFKDTQNVALNYVSIAFLVLYLICVVSVLLTIPHFINNKQKFLKYAKATVYSCCIVALAFFIAGYVFRSLVADTSQGSASSISFVPFIVLCIPALAFSVLEGIYRTDNPQSDKQERKKYRIEPLIFVILFTFGTFSSLFVKLIKMDVTSSVYNDSVSISGLTLLRDYSTMGSGYQILAFVMLTIYILSAIGLVLSVAGFFSKSDEYKKIAKITAYANVFFIFLIAMSGLYFTVGQKLNEDNLKAILASYGVDGSYEYSYRIYSETMYTLACEIIVLGVMIIRKVMQRDRADQINLNNAVIQAQLETTSDVAEVAQEDGVSGESEVLKEEPPIDTAPQEAVTETEQPPATAAAPLQESAYQQLEDYNFDPCPSFSELDAKIEIFGKELARRQAVAFQNPSLSTIAQFVVDYARECRLHLSYSKADIATFIAGLGASRLTILQGMSGTGKTSLPKIFAEAVCGVCDIVEVESSWKDKNELLGYYNEFSKTYTPKKFTYNLYKAALNSEIPTFIVLDEMNLSRIEYYFSDFLSIMEHEENKRRIKLLNVCLQNKVEGEKHDYIALRDGHTLNVPPNVWFIGTANRDESTFEISDKVYDRAQTMNFNKRAPKVRNFDKPLPQRFVSYTTFSALLSKAVREGKFDAEGSALIKSVEEILQPFNISFGNRILNQIEAFVNVYCRCFEDEDVLNTAVEKILLSKVVAKLEVKIIENKDVLVKRFEELGLTACADFVSKLNED